MNWFIKTPFGPNEDPVEHMVQLLAIEAEKIGIPLSDVEKELLLDETPDQETLPQELREKAKGLIAKILETESGEFDRDPKSFLDSLQWAGDSGYVPVVALAEEVACEIGGNAYPPLKGWQKIKDRGLLIGCGLLVVLAIFAIGAIGTVFFGWK